MKFKKNTIKPGMVIHCPTEEDAEMLLEYLEEIGYCWTTGAKPTEHVFNAGYYRISRFENKIWLDCGTIDDEITEFSDLIESDDSPTDSPMSAVKVLEWLHNVDANTIYKVFGISRLDEALAYYEVGEIIQKITAYEAAKKAPKPVEVEDGYWCKIYTEDDTVIEYIAHDVDEQAAKDGAIDRAMKETAESGERVFVDVKYVCWAKEDK